MKNAASGYFDVIVIGGGLSGLVVATQLEKAGLRICLLDRLSGDCSQSDACQGFIHSGLKLLDVPCDSPLKRQLAQGRTAWSRLLAAQQRDSIPSLRVDYLFATEGRMATSFPDVAARHDVSAKEVCAPAWSYGFRGRAFQTDEIAIDTSLLMQRLRHRLRLALVSENCLLVDAHPTQSAFQVVSDSGRTFQGGAIVLACAKSIPKLARHTPIGRVKIKQRPLSIATLQRMPFPVAAHVFDRHPWPTITLSSQSTKDGAWNWKIGGYIGDGMQPKESFETRVHLALQEYFPNLPPRPMTSRRIFRIEPDDGQRGLSEAGQLILDAGMALLLPNKATNIPAMAESALVHLRGPR